MKSITVSTPGKIHLMGEHAVVYGKPALLAAIDKRLRVSIEPSYKKGTTIVCDEPSGYVRHAACVASTHSGTSLPEVTITVVSDISPGYHLGSSAAVAVGVVAAVLAYLGEPWDLERINKIAYEVEKKQHGNPSGGDNTAVTYGGFTWFRKELEGVSFMQKLLFKPHKRLKHFFLIDTGRPKETTGEMVSLVKAKMRKQQETMEHLMHRNEVQTKHIATALRDGDEQKLMEAIRLGEETLEGMGVVSRRVKRAIREIENVGGAAKILGGGGKSAGTGYVLCYSPDRARVDSVCATQGYTTRNVSFEDEGVRLESTQP